MALEDNDNKTRILIEAIRQSGLRSSIGLGAEVDSLFYKIFNNALILMSQSPEITSREDYDVIVNCIADELRVELIPALLMLQDKK